jgi:cytochrome c nitrite reductase small subunit
MQIWSTVSLLPLLVSASLGFLMGLGGYTFFYAEGLSYLSNDPKACVNCHIMREQYDGWQKASHHQVATCNDCHVPHEFIPKYLAKMENGFWHSKGFTLQDFHEPIRIKPRNRAILQENCVGCHAELVGLIATHPGNDHQMLDCAKCHADVGHGPRR